jgi:predicted dehydrogenase
MVATDARVLVVGCGSIGRRHARVLRGLGVARIALCDAQPEAVERARAEIGNAEVWGSLEAALRHGYDACFLCTPPALHVSMAREALRYGADVFMEKPLSTSLDGVRELDAEARAAGRLLMVGYCFRYHEGLRLVRSMIAEGRIGRLIGVRASLGEDLSRARPGVDYRTLYVTAENVGVTLDLIHEPDFVRWIVRSAPQSVCAVTGKRSDLDMRGDDMADMLVTFRNGVVANVHLDFFQVTRRRSSEYLGTEGTITIEMTEWEKAVVSSTRIGESGWRTTVLPMERDDMFRAMDAEFLSCVAERKQPRNDLREGVESLRIALAARESSRTGRSVAITEGWT